MAIPNEVLSMMLRDVLRSGFTNLIVAMQVCTRWHEAGIRELYKTIVLDNPVITSRFAFAIEQNQSLAERVRHLTCCAFGNDPFLNDNRFRDFAKRLAQVIPYMKGLKTLSLRYPFCEVVAHDLRILLKSVPASVRSFEFSFDPSEYDPWRVTSGCEGGQHNGPWNACDDFARIISQAKHFRLRYLDSCPSMIPTTAPRLETLHINLLPEYWNNGTEEKGLDLAVRVRQLITAGAFPELRVCKILSISRCNGALKFNTSIQHDPIANQTTRMPCMWFPGHAQEYDKCWIRVPSAASKTGYQAFYSTDWKAQAEDIENGAWLTARPQGYRFPGSFRASEDDDGYEWERLRWSRTRPFGPVFIAPMIPRLFKYERRARQELIFPVVHDGVGTRYGPLSRQQAQEELDGDISFSDADSDYCVDEETAALGQLSMENS